MFSVFTFLRELVGHVMIFWKLNLIEAFLSLHRPCGWLSFSPSTVTLAWWTLEQVQVGLGAIYEPLRLILAFLNPILHGEWAPPPASLTKAEGESGLPSRDPKSGLIFLPYCPWHIQMAQCGPLRVARKVRSTPLRWSQSVHLLGFWAGAQFS